MVRQKPQCTQSSSSARSGGWCRSNATCAASARAWPVGGGGRRHAGRGRRASRGGLVGVAAGRERARRDRAARLTARMSSSATGSRSGHTRSSVAGVERRRTACPPSASTSRAQRRAPARDRRPGAARRRRRARGRSPRRRGGRRAASRSPSRAGGTPIAATTPSPSQGRVAWAAQRASASSASSTRAPAASPAASAACRSAPSSLDSTRTSSAPSGHTASQAAGTTGAVGERLREGGDRLRRRAVERDRARRVGQGVQAERDLGDDRERAERAAEQLGEVVAGDVLHDPPAGAARSCRRTSTKRAPMTRSRGAP